MSTDFVGIFATLKPVMAEQAELLAIQKDTPIEYFARDQRSFTVSAAQGATDVVWCG